MDKKGSLVRKFLYVFAAIFASVLLFLFLFSTIELMTPEEEQKLKEGRLFWRWESPQGSFAMHYIEKGEGSKHILLLHGFRSHTYTWRYLIDPLASAGYHVWAVDLIGYGLSDKPAHVNYDMNFFIQQMNSFMEFQGISKVHLIGNSMGGGLALHLAIAQPQRSLSITLLSALGYPLDMPLYLSIGRHINLLWAPFLSPTMVRYCLKQIVFKSELVTEEQVDAYSLPYRLPNGIISSILTLQQFDNQLLKEMGKSYTRLKNPLLVIWGKCDSLIPVSHFEKFLKDFPHAKNLLIENCGHIPQEEAPQEVLAAILSFLQSTENK